jgi:hypothetical protein
VIRTSRRRAALVCGLGLALACAGQQPGATVRAPAAAPPAPAPTPPAPARVLLISIAGLTPEHYLGRPGERPLMPRLAELAARGAAARHVEPVAPAADLPALASLASGLVPSHHGVTSDALVTDQGVVPRSLAPSSPPRGPTLWAAAHDAGLRSAILGWPGATTSKAEVRFPEVVAPGAGPPAADFLAQGLPPALLEVARRLGAETAEARVPSAKRDAVLVGLACELAASSEPPALLLLALGQTEPPLLAQGPGSPAADAAFRSADESLGRLLDCFEHAGKLTDAAVVVVGDHGWLPVHTALAPNSALADAGLLTLIAPGTPLLQRWSALARSNGGSAFVYARKEQDAVLARRALAEAAARAGAFHIVSAEEMLRLGADREAWFGLEADPGYVFVNDPNGPLARTAPERGAGGYLPDEPAMAPGFVAAGAGLRQGLVVPTLRQIDVAPTVARLLGLRLEGTDGRVVVGLLRAP